MAEFCKCGSLVIQDKCSNKNCSFRTDKPTAGSKTSASKSKGSAEKKAKTPGNSSRRSSKVVTFKLSDFMEEENKNQKAFGEDEDNAYDNKYRDEADSEEFDEDANDE